MASSGSSTALHRAAAVGKCEDVLQLLREGANVNCQDAKGWTPLHLAVRNGHIEAVRLLTDAGADFESKTDYGRTPLHWAARKGHFEAVRLLTDAGANLGGKDSWNATPLHLAAWKGHLDAMRMLTEAGAQVKVEAVNGWTPLHLTATDGHLEGIRLLIDAGAHVNAKVVDGRTPLHLAAREGHVEAVRLLADAGANLGGKDAQGQTPLHLAAGEGHVEAVRLLADAGANLGGKDAQGRTPLHRAALGGHLESVRVLTDAGAETDTKDVNGWSPLASSSALGNLAVVNVLLSQGRADPNLPNDNGWMPMDYAAHYNHCVIIKELKAFGAKGSSVSRSPENTETVAGISAMLEGVVELANLKAGAHPEEKDLSSCAALTGNLTLTRKFHETLDANASDRRDISLLHYAALGGHDCLIKSLTDAGGNVTALTPNGASVLHFASLSGRLSTVQMVAQLIAGQCAQASDHEHMAEWLSKGDAQGLTAEHYAQARGHHHIAWWLSKGHTKLQDNIRLSLNALRNLVEENVEKMVYPSINVEACEALLNCGVWDLHYQDERGRTPLHVAALNNRTDEVLFLLERGALPSARTHDLKTPSELAALTGHSEIASLLSRRNPNQPESESDKCRLYEQLLRLIVKTSQAGCEDEPRRCLDAVKQCTFLLESGAPLEPLCCQDAHALHLAITCNCTPLLPLLLSTGVPLTASLDSLGPVGLAWWAENVTPWVGVFVSRAVEHKLRTEMDFEAVTPNENILKRMMTDLIEALRGDRPWRAEWPDFLIQEMNDLDRLLYTACRRGATTAAWWIWQKGGHINPLINQGSTPLHAAIEAGNVPTALAMINHMKANPFLTDSKGKTVLDLLPDEDRKKHLENTQRKESRILNKALMSTKDNVDQRDLMYLTLFHLVLTLQHGYKPAEAIPEFRWKSVFMFMIDSLKEQVTPLSWIPDLVTSLNDRCRNLKKTPHSTDSENMCEYSILRAVAKELFTLSDQQTEIQNVSYKFDQDHKALQSKALRLCCKEDLPLFLHLLVTVAGVSVDDVIDTDYNMTALHHAARYNNQSALVYLLNHRAFETPRDMFGNVPTHHAFMHGHRDIVKAIDFPVANSTGVTPGEIGKSFTQYMEIYRVDTDNNELEPHERNDVTKVTRIHLKRLGEEWEKKGIASSVEEIHIDFTKGESLEIMRAINKLIERLMTEVKHVEPLLEGDHEMLGSAADNVRLYGPDEYDTNVVLKNISGHLDGGIQVSLKSNRVDNEGRTAFINLTSDREDIQHLLQGSNLMERFYEVVKECFHKCQIEDKRLSVTSPGITRTQVGVGLNLVWMGREFKILHVGVDLVPTIEAPWPDQLPRPKLTPEDLKTVYINSTGRGQWRFSFARAENMIMKKLTDGQRTVFLVCKMILSRLKVEGWAPQVIKIQYKYFNNKFFHIPSPKGFSLKNSFFLELEEVRDANLWTQEHSFERIISIFRRMCVEVCNPVTMESVLDSGKMKAYFGGNFEAACAGFGAPDVVRFLESLENRNIWSKPE